MHENLAVQSHMRMHTTPPPAGNPATLKRELGLIGAVMMGLGSIIGTGVFVSIGIAAGVTGPSVVLAIAIAGLLAMCNALSSAQLAASHPTSGGTYEYGYVYLSPTLGFSAGWMFLCAKSASAATAALGLAGYTLANLGITNASWRIALALAAVLTLGLIVLGGMRRSNLTNIIIVSLTLAGLAYFMLSGIPHAIEHGPANLRPFFSPSGHAAPRLLEASALMFVAFTGYGRIATLGEEVTNPRRTIPLAILVTLGVSMLIYLGVGLIAVASAGTAVMGTTGVALAAPLAVVAAGFDTPSVAIVISIGAITAMLGVLLNLILGLSRVALAMGRRKDLPAVFARLNTRATTPTYAVVLVTAVIAGLVSIGSIKLAWSLSAFTVLVYYAITNLAAIRMPSSQRLYHRAFAWAGLVGCLSLAFWVEPRVWITGLTVLAAGLGFRLVFRRGRPAPDA